MNVFQAFTEHVRTAVDALAKAGVFAAPPDLGRIVVELPREASHGDLATNAAMALAAEEQQRASGSSATVSTPRLKLETLHSRPRRSRPCRCSRRLCFTSPASALRLLAWRRKRTVVQVA